MLVMGSGLFGTRSLTHRTFAFLRRVYPAGLGLKGVGLHRDDLVAHLDVPCALSSIYYVHLVVSSYERWELTLHPL